MRRINGFGAGLYVTYGGLARLAYAAEQSYTAAFAGFFYSVFVINLRGVELSPLPGSIAKVNRLFVIIIYRLTDIGKRNLSVGKFYSFSVGTSIQGWTSPGGIKYYS